MEARFREDYPGEFVITKTQWGAGKRTENREWIPNPIVNQHISGRAVCIGDTSAKEQYDYTRLQRHRGGLLSSLKLQTYGTSDIALEMPLDFAVEIDPTKLQLLKESAYYENNVVYTTARNCIANPGLFYLIPYAPHLVSRAILPYLAAFDGHKEVFLLGYTNDTDKANPRWINDLLEVFSAYPAVKFFLVGEQSNIPATLFELPNVEGLYYKQFFSYCDV